MQKYIGRKQLAHIDVMGRLFFFVFNIISPIMTVVQLFLPIFLKTNVHYDMNRRKFGFAVYIFGFIRIFGGYAATYKGGLALHISDKKAILIPYSKINSERKRFSFMRSFHLTQFTLTTETGAEYLCPIALAHTALRTYFFVKGGKKEKVKNNLWLTDGDVLRISLNFTVRCTLFILLCNFFKFLKEKIKELRRKKTRKSIA